MRLKTAILSLFSVLCVHLGLAQSIRFYQVNDLDDYSQVLEMSIAENQFMLLAIYQNNGDFEEMIRAGVFKDDSLKKHFEGIIPTAIYRQSEMANRLVESFGEKVLPTFLFMNSEEFLLNAAYGKQSEADLIDFLIASKSLGAELDQLRTAYKRNKLSDLQWVKLIGLYELNLDFLSTQALAYEFLSDVPREKLLSDTVKPVSLAYGISLETPYPERILAIKEQLDSAEFADFYAACYSFNLDMAIENKDSVLLQKLLDMVVPAANFGDSVKSEMILESKKLFAAESGQFNLWQQEVLNQCRTLSNPKEKAEFAFQAAYEIAEKYNSKSAQKATRNLAAKASYWYPDYRYYMLEGYMAYLLKDFDEALTAIDKAMELSVNDQDTDKAERLKNIVTADKESE